MWSLIVCPVSSGSSELFVLWLITVYDPALSCLISAFVLPLRFDVILDYWPCLLFHVFGLCFGLNIILDWLIFDLAFSDTIFCLNKPSAYGSRTCLRAICYSVIGHRGSIVIIKNDTLGITQKSGYEFNSFKVFILLLFFMYLQVIRTYTILILLIHKTPRAAFIFIFDSVAFIYNITDSLQQTHHWINTDIWPKDSKYI